MIVGITGTIGAGKGTVVEHLVQEKGFAHYSVRDFLCEELVRRGLPLDRDSMRETANALRAEHEPAYIITTLYERAQAAGRDALIESVRALGEAEFLKERGVKLLAVDAKRRVRFDRIVARGSSTDHIDFATFVAQEEKELSSTDPFGQNILGVMKMADCRIENNGTLEELYRRIEQALPQLRS